MAGIDHQNRLKRRTAFKPEPGVTDECRLSRLDGAIPSSHPFSAHTARHA